MPLRTPSLALSVLLFLAPAVVMADAPQAFITSKQATDYRTRLDSTRALFAAYQRLVAHRPGSESSVREFQTALTEAERLYFERHPDQAQELINKTYEQLKRGIESSVGPANPPLASAEAAQPSTSSTTAVRSRLESARALLTAYQRLRGEQSAGESLALRAESGLADADRQLQSGRVAEATRSIDDLYDLLKRAIESSVDPASQVRPTQAGGPDPARLAQDYHNRLDSVRTLLAAYQRIPGDPADTALRVQRVQASMAEAERLFFAEKLAEARARLDVIYDDIKRAIDARVAATPREAIQGDTGNRFLEEKARQDYTVRLNSSRALLAAYQRIAKEKRFDVLGTLKAHEQRLNEAEKQAAANQIAAARKQVDEVYAALKVSIEALRRGETLVRELKFANKAEEYAYEEERNRAYFMLIRLLLDETAASPQFDQLLDQAENLQRQALGLANRKAYKEAIARLEESTRVLQRAIRSAGVYIPG